ncbi:MAG: metallophosphoesterase [Candidatus Aenigmarchaeota archaeon]|nr:metallophosphoesterase [Candidatus Aenigmarchaeota archaeon]
MNMGMVLGKPALLINEALIIADLHIGIEFEYYKSGIKIPSTTEMIKNEIENLLKKTKPKRLIILGDVKHKVPGITKQELREIPDMLYHLGTKLQVEIIPGNHDAGLKKLIPSNIVLHPSKGIMLDKAFLLHGHCWPADEFLQSEYVIVGHEHPQIEFCDSLGYRFSEPVWLRAKLNKNALKRRYAHLPEKLPELIVMPRFNKLSGGIAFNRPISEIKRHKAFGIGTLVKSSKLDEAEVYLLDGTFLGNLKELY